MGPGACYLDALTRKGSESQIALWTIGLPPLLALFERGAGEDKQIFLPAPGWRGSASQFHPDALPPELWQRARAIAAAAHPAFAGLDPFIQALHTRNVFQVLGPELNAPADFVLCWTADGEASGGTGQAIRIAAAHGVPVYNFQSPRERAHVERHLSL